MTELLKKMHHILFSGPAQLPFHNKSCKCGRVSHLKQYKDKIARALNLLETEPTQLGLGLLSINGIHVKMR